jgi:hypothetical protein
MCPFHAASAMRGNSRQTDLELPIAIRVAQFCHAAWRLSVTGKPRFKGSRITGALWTLPPERHNRASGSIAVSILVSQLVS